MLIGLIAVLVYVVGSMYQPTVVMGRSMEPTLKSGRVIWVDRLYYTTHRPRPGEVIVFKYQGDVYVKRVYRAPGETLHYVAAGDDWLGPIREQRADEMIREYDAMRARSSLRVKEMRVPADAVFVLGDNYTNSEDSRNFGPIPLSSVIGRAHLERDTTRTLPWEMRPMHVRRTTPAPVRETALTRNAQQG